MAIDLKTLKPTTVSRDLKGKFVFLYGAPKVGKTTLAVQFPRNLLLAVEHGFNVIDNIYAVDVPSWGEFKKYVKQLQDDDLKGMFDTVTIDTIGLLYDRCESYICDREGVDKLSDIPYGGGYKMLDQEFETTLRKITQIMDKDGKIAYGLCLIGHEKVRVETDGQTSIKHITPDISDRCAKIVNRMVDITAYIGFENGARYIYPRQLVLTDGSQTTEIYAGSHFANLNDKIELSYDALVNAIADAMTTNFKGEEVKLSDAPVTVVQEEKLDFKEIRNSIGKIVKKLKALDEETESSVRMQDYKHIVEQYLGKGRLVKECDESQVEHLSLILDDLEAYVKENNL